MVLMENGQNLLQLADLDVLDVENGSRCNSPNRVLMGRLRFRSPQTFNEIWQDLRVHSVFAMI